MVALNYNARKKRFSVYEDLWGNQTGIYLFSNERIW